MEDNKDVEQTEEVVEEVKEEVAEQPTETVEELKQRLENAKAENARKAQEIQRFREAQETVSQPKPRFDPVDVRTWNDNELKACLKDPQYAVRHDEVEEELNQRRFRRFHAEKEEQTTRMNSELERQKEYPETLDPTHPMAVRMTELMHLHRLNNTPSGRLVAAKLAHAEVALKAKSVAAGRKAEQNRQADVKANFQGESGRPAPKVSDKVKDDELKKRAQAGDKAAQVEWFKRRQII